MTAVAVALAAALVVQTLAYGGLLLRQERRHSRRIDNLLDRLAHAHGRTWMPAPADNGEQEEQLTYSGYDPSQDPDL